MVEDTNTAPSALKPLSRVLQNDTYIVEL